MNNDRNDYSPIRLCYHRGVHYNSIVDPQKATIGVGLGKCCHFYFKHKHCVSKDTVYCHEDIINL